MKKLSSFFLACCLFSGAFAVADVVPLEIPTGTCHPIPKTASPQYIIGYGSLMEDASRQRSAPQSTEVTPVRVQGFRRAWTARGASVGFSTTFLGVSQDAKSGMNAVLFPLQNEADIANMDARENGYCRAQVSKDQIETLDLSAVPDGEIWLYVNKLQSMDLPSSTFPIVQSYVDVFLTGCLQVEAKYQLPGFARECVVSTHNWSKHWVNDRIYPRRPFVYQPNAGAIDRLLNKEVPTYFQSIRIE